MIDNANIETFPLSTLDTMDALLSIRCYNCQNRTIQSDMSSWFGKSLSHSLDNISPPITDNSEPIIIRKTGRKIFRIEARCVQCKNIKSKKFCDTYNKLPYQMYQLQSNKIYVNYTPSGIKFTDLAN